MISFADDPELIPLLLGFGLGASFAFLIASLVIWYILEKVGTPGTGELDMIVKPKIGDKNRKIKILPTIKEVKEILWYKRILK